MSTGGVSAGAQGPRRRYAPRVPSNSEKINRFLVSASFHCPARFRLSRRPARTSTSRTPIGTHARTHARTHTQRPLGRPSVHTRASRPCRASPVRRAGSAAPLRDYCSSGGGQSLLIAVLAYFHRFLDCPHHCLACFQPFLACPHRSLAGKQAAC